MDAAPQAITDAQYAFRITPSPAFHHIVVFLLPGTTLPAGLAASVYIQLPPSQEFKFVAGIGPGKESTIFKVNGVYDSASNGDVDAMADDATGQNGVTRDIVVGISVEPGEKVDAQLAALKQGQSAGQSTALVRTTASVNNVLSTKQLAKNIIGNAFDFLASFGSDTVPLKAFQNWWTKFEHKIDLDPSFLERRQDG